MSGAPGQLQRAFERTHTAPSEFISCGRAVDNDTAAAIAIERTSCYGFCSMYTMVLHGNGTVEYQGVANVPFVGKRRGKLPIERFHYLAQLASEIGYFDLQDNYDCGVTDNPTVYTKVEQNGASKLIRHYAPEYTGPARLRAFEEVVDSAQTWIEWEN